MRVLLKNDTGHFFHHPDDRGNNPWTPDPATAHHWVDIDRAADAVKTWQLIHGEQLTLEVLP